MIKYCCYYCYNFKQDICKEQICYNAFAHPLSVKEGKWYCQQYEDRGCEETVTNNGLVKETHSKCWKEVKK